MRWRALLSRVVVGVEESELGRVRGLRLVSAVAGPLALGYLSYRAVVTAVNAATLPRLRAGEGAGAVDARPAWPGRVSLLVPARDEAANLATTLPALLAQGADAVVVLDDASTDATAQIAHDAGARVVPGAPLPPGWVGKTWACHQLAHEAAGATGDAPAPDDLLVFVDADVTLGPGALAALVSTLDRTGADLLTVFPRQRTPTLAERLITPLVDAAFVGHLPAVLMRTRVGLTAANGQVMAFRRSAYDAAGGHAAVRGDVVEDLALADRTRRAGGHVVVALGGELIDVRMYDGYRTGVAGFAKSARGVHGDSRPLLVASALWFVMTYTLPWLLPTTPLVRAARLAGLADRAVVNLVTGRTAPLDLAEGLLGPVTPLLALPVYWRALRRPPLWKGRSYPAGGASA